MPQEEINRILLREALEGHTVVRLKGGDPFLFGRGGEELELLAEWGVPFEVVPGVTSAVAVPAYAGIPVTHRDCCSSVHIITGHTKKSPGARTDYRALVRLGGTLVFLMGSLRWRSSARDCSAAASTRPRPPQFWSGDHGPPAADFWNGRNPAPKGTGSGGRDPGGHRRGGGLRIGGAVLLGGEAPARRQAGDRHPSAKAASRMTAKLRAGRRGPGAAVDRDRAGRAESGA
ncbi:MAG: uroporphyrinogen-III C-methyltransferase [Anaerotruncus massiliensis (ex Togo et al. 2019)]